MISVERSPVAPRILTESTAEDRYRHREVFERLKEDFHGKCYICETTPLQDPEVEHLLPHKKGAFPERKFDWNNLFLCCRHCNGVKNKAKYDGRVIDCCVRDPEELLEQELVEDTVSVRVVDAGDDEAVGTAELIEEVFMSSNPPLREHASKVRLEELQMRMNLLYKALGAYQKNAGDSIARRNVRSMLKKESKFAGFTRCYVRKNLAMYPELAQYLY